MSQVFELCPRCTTEDLVSYGFRKCSGRQNYHMELPLYRYKDKPVIDACFIASPLDNYISYDVVDICNDTLYAAYYGEDLNNNVVLAKIKHIIEFEITKLKNANIIKLNKEKR